LREFNPWDGVFPFRGKGLNSYNVSIKCKKMCVLYGLLNWWSYGFAHVESLGYNFRNIIGEERERCLRVWKLLVVNANIFLRHV
jgi:hypothetical protein